MVTLVPGLPPELLEMFEAVLQQFANGYSFLVASRVEFLSGFVLAELPASNTSKLRAVWLQSSHVLSVVEGEAGFEEKMGFHP